MNKRERQQLNREQQQAKAEKRSQFQKIGLWALLVLLAATLVYSLTQTVVEEITGDTPNVQEVSAADQIKGRENAPLVLVKYSDFQCPSCRTQHRSIEQAWDSIKRKVRVVYRHFPLSNTHAHAHLAARYAEAAGLQGQFWGMHDALFANQPEWARSKEPESLFTLYARRLRLDIDKLKTDVESAAIKDKVNNDIASGRAANVTATPTLFLNGKPISNIQRPQALIQAINAADAAAKAN